MFGGRKKMCFKCFDASVKQTHYIAQSHIPSPVCVCSTNGTVINMSKLVKKQTHMLQHGDVIYFVYRKSEPEQSGLLILFFSIPRDYVDKHL